MHRTPFWQSRTRLKGKRWRADWIFSQVVQCCLLSRECGITTAWRDSSFSWVPSSPASYCWWMRWWVLERIWVHSRRIRWRKMHSLHIFGWRCLFNEFRILLTQSSLYLEKYQRKSGYFDLRYFIYYLSLYILYVFTCYPSKSPEYGVESVYWYCFVVSADQRRVQQKRLSLLWNTKAILY